MAKIGGNIRFAIQTKQTEKDEAGNIVTNEIGEPVEEWKTAHEFVGWLGLQSGDSKHTTYNAKVEESTHVFLCDFHAGIYSLADQNTRMIVKGFVYDVLLIDNPDEMNEQLEIYVKRVGAWNG